MAKHEHDFRDGLTSAWATTGITTRASFTIPGCASPMDPDKIEPWLRSHDLFDEEHEEIYIGLRCAAVQVPGGVR